MCYHNIFQSIYSRVPTRLDHLLRNVGGVFTSICFFPCRWSSIHAQSPSWMDPGNPNRIHTFFPCLIPRTLVLRQGNGGEEKVASYLATPPSSTSYPKQNKTDEFNVISRLLKLKIRGNSH